MWKKVIIFCSIFIFGLLILMSFVKFFDNTESKKLDLNVENGDYVETISTEEKVSINTNILLENRYLECMHVDEEKLEIPSDIINMKEDEVINYFKEIGMIVEDFSSDNINLKKEISGICDKHFIIKFGNKSDIFLSVFKIKENGELSLYKETDIAKEYLTALDNDKLDEGIEVYGYENVESVLEDYE